MKISLDPCLYFIKVWKVKLFTIEKLEKHVLPPHGDFGQYPCWNIFARK